MDKNKNESFKKYMIFIFLFFSFTITSYGAFKYLQIKDIYNSSKEFVFEDDNYNENSSDSYKNELNIVYCTDNNYLFPTYISMFSLLEHSCPDEAYNVTILCSPDISQENLKKFESIKKKYKNCFIKLINMEKKFGDIYSGKWSTAMYYRFSIPEILSNVKTCLYLDSDTLILKNVNEIFNIDLKDNYIGGIRDYGIVNKESKYHQTNLKIGNLDNYICSGVLLMNLEKIREDKIDKKLIELVKSDNKEHKFDFPDQDAINVVCFNKILPLPFKYGLLIQINISEDYEVSDYAKWASDKEMWDEARFDPVIVHFTTPKPWVALSKFAENWWQTVKRSSYFNEIYPKYIKNFNKDSRIKIDQLINN